MSLGCVVVGVDGSEQSMRAVAFAIKVLEGTAGRLVVATAYVDRPELPDADNAALRDEQVADGEAARRLAEDAAVECSLMVEEGSPTEVIESVARREAADLIVVGTRGRGALARAMMGSVATYLTTHGSLPATVVH